MFVRLLRFAFRRPPTFLFVVAVAPTALGCGSSGPSEGKAQELLQEHTQLSSVECVRSTSSDREFDCTGEIDGSPVTVAATVAESGNTIVVTHCRNAEPSSWWEPCEEVIQGSPSP